MYCDKENVNILIALLVAHGIEDIVVCPGSRNAPLVHNFNECPELTCHAVTDERSAAFIALGIRQQKRMPVAVCVTSGSALLNLLPGVAEAAYQQQGIIVISADRPEAWVGQLDGQTIPQPMALGTFVKKSVSLPIAMDKEQRWLCNRLVNEALMEAFSPESPSVHINVPISEPLFSFTTAHLPEERKVERIYSLSTTLEKLHSALHPIIIFGQTPSVVPERVIKALRERFVVLYEPLSADSQELSLLDQMMFAIEGKEESYTPDCVVYFGGNTISKRLRHFLRRLPSSTLHITVSENGLLHDTSMNTRYVVQSPLFTAINKIIEGEWIKEEGYDTRRTMFLDLWNSLRCRIEKKHKAFLPEYSQLLVVKKFEETVVTENDTVYYANSMAIRLAAVFSRHHILCNRGINGIEGSMSVAVGAARAMEMAGKKGRVFCVIGDLSFFYDNNALWQQELPRNLRILLLNNGGGGIFRNLPGLDSSPASLKYVSASHNTSASGICLQNGVAYLSVSDSDSLEESLHILSSSSSPTLLEAFSSQEADRNEYKKYYNNLKGLM